LFGDLLRVQLILKGVITEEDWKELRNEINFVFNTDNYFWDLKEAEIRAERLKALSMVEPYIGKYFSTDYIKKNVLRQTEEEINTMSKEMEKDLAIMRQQQMQQMQQEQMAQMAQMDQTNPEQQQGQPQ
jgi:hypothetical protein